MFGLEQLDKKKPVILNFDLDDSAMSEFMPHANNDLNGSKDLSTILKQTCKTSDDEQVSRRPVSTLESQKKQEVKQFKYYDHSSLLTAPACAQVPRDLI